MKEALLMRRAPAPIGSPTRDCLLPVDDAAAEALAKLPMGKPVAVEVRKGRSLVQLRTYWAVLEYVSQATDWTPQRLHIALKVKLGFYEPVELNGKIVPVIRSAGFDDMKHAEFCDYMGKAMALLCETVLPGYDPGRLVSEAQHALGVKSDTDSIVERGAPDRPGAHALAGSPCRGAEMEGEAA